MIPVSHIVAFIGGLSFLMGCTTAPTVAAAEPVPALISEPTAASTAEISEVISTVLGNRKVTLSRNVFRQKSDVVIERRIMMGPDGNPVMGRDLSKPDRFTLVKKDATCFLIHEKTGKSYPLTQVICEPI